MPTSITRFACPKCVAAQVWRFSGALPRRDASEAEADQSLTRTREPWPAGPTLSGLSPYRAMFRDGATNYPRRFFFVERQRAGRLGSSPAAPRVRGKTSSLDKPPWKAVQPPEGPVEKEFLRPVLLGESIAPFRILAPAPAMIPVEGAQIHDAASAAAAGHRYLAAWLRTTEAAWAAHAGKKADGTLRMTLTEQLDYMSKLSNQLLAANLRVVYTKSGTLLAAAILDDPSILIDHMAYWAAIANPAEARYLVAILDSETVRARVASMQSRGQGGARHFDKLVWELRIPRFSSGIALHRALAAAAAKAERAASLVSLPGGAYFTRQRRTIRDALRQSGIADTIDQLVDKLLAAP